MKSIRTAHVKQIFPHGTQTIGGCAVDEGVLLCDGRVRILRAGVIVYEGTIESLKRGRAPVQVAIAGQECGVLLALSPIAFAFHEGDRIECYEKPSPIQETVKSTAAPSARQPATPTQPLEIALQRLRTQMGSVDEEAALGFLYLAAKELDGYEYHDIHRNKRIQYFARGRVMSDTQTRVSLRKGSKSILEH